ncbi:MAG: 3-deoxy-7-phosphoheptulonate synthase class II [Candidatus Sumerlaeota bacterium]|nr:3-deoxy-7-phosphoheptulonate synthase class II [Candidatus Sumerlaeota bacterium]
MSKRPWAPDGWRSRQPLQQPEYPDVAEFRRALEEIRRYPPLVAPGEVERLRLRMAEAGRGAAFILQGGNCAERFIDCRGESIANKLKILLQMSVILTYGVRRPVVRIGRIAGQYAKPRSSEYETVGGQRLHSYRGDAVNGVEPVPSARTPDPRRLQQGYFYSAATLNHIRALIDGGFADLRHPHNWDLKAIERSRRWPENRDILDRILDAIRFMESFGGVHAEALGRIDFYTSHEGLLLDYEEALTRRDAESGLYYNLGAHLVWIGARTRQVDGAHVEYFRGIANPVGVKIDSSCGPDELIALLEALNPDNQEGRVALITRLGAGRVEEALPPLIRAVQSGKRAVVWICDPMHANTQNAEGGRKTRDFSVILDELTRTFQIHKAEGSRLAGVHFELTAEDVTECLGGGEDLTHADLDRNYETYCDPRLNNAQSLEMAFLIARLLQT